MRTSCGGQGRPKRLLRKMQIERIYLGVIATLSSIVVSCAWCKTFIIFIACRTCSRASPMLLMLELTICYFSQLESEHHGSHGKCTTGRGSQFSLSSPSAGRARLFLDLTYHWVDLTSHRKPIPLMLKVQAIDERHAANYIMIHAWSFHRDCSWI